MTAGRWAARLAGCLLLAVCGLQAGTNGDAIVAAANAFLASLSPQQKQAVMYSFNNDEQRRRWSNFPTGFVPRGGLSLKQLDAGQQAAVSQLLQVTLSARGYEKVQQIMEGDETLRQNEGGNPMFGKDLYYISLLGEPSTSRPWMLQFGGHHLALNITMVGAQGILTPTLTGAQPSLYQKEERTVRPLAGESDKAVALLESLDAQQRKQAILGYRLADLVLGPGQDGKTIQPEGLKASAMNDEQRALLVTVMSEWVGIINDASAKARMAELTADIEQTWFAWSGPVDVKAGTNIAAYYRIQGPHVVIEYAPQRMGGDPAMHVHTMYRDPTNDYGRKLVSR